MPDRYGERDDEEERAVVFDHSPAEGPTVVDFDSRRQAREIEERTQAARKQRERLSETRATHAPLDRGQSARQRAHQRHVTDRANAQRRAMRIVNCGLCDDDGYRGVGAVCDHVDRTRTASRGMAAVRAAMGWDAPQAPTPITGQAPADPQPRSGAAEPIHTSAGDDEPPWHSEPPPEDY